MATTLLSTLQVAGRTLGLICSILQSGCFPLRLQHYSKRKVKGGCGRPGLQMPYPTLARYSWGYRLLAIVPMVPLTSPLQPVQPAAFRHAFLPQAPLMTSAFLSPKCWTESRTVRCPALLTASSSCPGRRWAWPVPIPLEHRG